MSGYIIGSVLSQLTNLDRWHLVAYYSQKKILAKTRYETHNGEFLAIVKAFQTWQYYIEGCKHKMLMLTNHNNLCHFMETKSLNSCQVWWAQKLSQYHFEIDYCQGKANGAADALSQFFQRSDDEEEKLWAKNSQILHQLQSSLTHASLLKLSVMFSSLSPCHQVLICGTHVLP